MSDNLKKEYKHKDKISRYKEILLKKTGKNSRRTDRPNMYYPIYYNPQRKFFSLENGDDIIEILPIIENEDGRWRWGKETFLENKDTELVAKKIRKTWNVYTKMRDIVNNKIRTIKPKTLWLDPKYDTGNGNRTLENVLGKVEFPNPKPLEQIKDIIRVGCPNYCIVLDFFAGSGTTGQAVLELNKEDGGSRQFILCTNNENNIAEKITYQRLKTVITGVRPDNTKYSDGIPGNLRYFKTDFVNEEQSIDATRDKLTAKAEEMICIRENSFHLVETAKKYEFFANDSKFVAIIYDGFAMTDIWSEIERLNIEKLLVKLYIFSYSSDTSVFTDLIPSTSTIKWQSEPIPERILQTYRKLFKPGRH
jgi:adenine-specific DNA-methyltransferase